MLDLRAQPQVIVGHTHTLQLRLDERRTKGLAHKLQTQRRQQHKRSEIVGEQRGPSIHQTWTNAYHQRY